MKTRRDFLKSTALATAGLAMGGISTKMSAAGYNRIVGANKKVNLAYIGIGNRGLEVIKQFANTELANVVALCDVDLGADHTKEALGMYPKAKRFKDFREMFDKLGNEIEAVSICTPDFAHFPAVMMSMTEGKHVFVEKPLTRTFHESELLIKASRSEEHTSELQSRPHLVCRLLLEK